MSPFVLSVYSKAFVRLGFVGDPISFTVTPRHNRLPTASLTIASDHRRVPDLFADGARLTVGYDGKRILSGVVRLRRGTRSPVGTLTFDIADDWRIFQQTLGWPVPGAALTAQTSEYHTVTGPAETVVKTLATANMVSRLGRPVTVAPDLGRGATITVKLRMMPLADQLLPLIDQAGLGVTIKQSGAGFLLDCYVPALHPRTLTEKSGVVVDWEFSEASPTATRTVVGGPGEGTARAFRQVVDPARETAWGDVWEVFRDARDVPADAVDRDALMDARGAETVAEGAPKFGLKVSLAETSTFRYGRAVTVGDRVRLEVGPGIFHEDVLREAVLSWTRDGGLKVTPLVGERTDEPDTVLARAVAALGRGLRTLSAGR